MNEFKIQQILNLNKLKNWTKFEICSNFKFQISVICSDLNKFEFWKKMKSNKFKNEQIHNLN
jgi:hypothetical protein